METMTLEERRAAPVFPVPSEVTPCGWYAYRTKNWYIGGVDEIYGAFDKALASGKSYLFGKDFSSFEYISKCTKPIPVYLRNVVLLAFNNPSEEYRVVNVKRTRDYTIRKRGEYVDISLPHHSAGGEKSWITKDCKKMVLVNVD